MIGVYPNITLHELQYKPANFVAVHMVSSKVSDSEAIVLESYLVVVK